MNKYLVLTHGADLDGLMCGLLLKKGVENKGNTIDRVLVDYADFTLSLDDAYNNSSNYTKIFITDLSLNTDKIRRKVLKLASVCKELYVIDHHIETKLFYDSLNNKDYASDYTGNIIFHIDDFSSTERKSAALLLLEFMDCRDTFDFSHCDMNCVYNVVTMVSYWDTFEWVKHSKENLALLTKRLQISFACCKDEDKFLETVGKLMGEPFINFEWFLAFRVESDYDAYISVVDLYKSKISKYEPLNIGGKRIGIVTKVRGVSNKMVGLCINHILEEVHSAFDIIVFVDDYLIRLYSVRDSVKTVTGVLGISSVLKDTYYATSKRKVLKAVGSKVESNIVEELSKSSTTNGDFAFNLSKILMLGSNKVNG